MVAGARAVSVGVERRKNGHGRKGKDKTRMIPWFLVQANRRMEFSYLG